MTSLEAFQQFLATLPTDIQVEADITTDPELISYTLTQLRVNGSPIPSTKVEMTFFRETEPFMLAGTFLMLL